MAEKRKDPAAAALGRKGGKATAKNLTAEERAESARNAVKARWTKWRAAQASEKAKRSAAKKKPGGAT